MKRINHGFVSSICYLFRAPPSLLVTPAGGWLINPHKKIALSLCYEVSRIGSLPVNGISAVITHRIMLAKDNARHEILTVGLLIREI